MDYASGDMACDFAVVRPVVFSLLPATGQGLRVLDVGCGNGFWAGALARRGFEVVGLDPSPTGIAAARTAMPGLRFEVLGAAGDLCALLGERPFDFVVSLEVVEHLYAPREWAAACYGALKPGGRLICSTPYHGFLKNLSISLANGWDRHFAPNWDGGHIKFWSRKTLTRLLAGAGFQRSGMRFRGAGRIPYLWKSLVLAARR
jgi:2-polyprenyl-3-methyl-5-hydroxy-6-metoxy-1,4-benzoquinol methylase